MILLLKTAVSGSRVGKMLASPCFNLETAYIVVGVEVRNSVHGGMI